VPTPQIPKQVDVFNQNGELGSLPLEQVQDALNSGFKIASPEDVHAYDNEVKYGSTGQTLKAGAEGAARAATFGLSTGVETALGVKPEDIKGREEENPAASTIGEVAGLAGSTLIPGGGAAKLLEKAGAGAALKLGLGEMVLNPQTGKMAYEAGKGLSRVGSFAVKGAVENSLLQSGNEVHKMFVQDPNQSAESVAANVGLASIIGGGIGSGIGIVSPLWEQTAGKKLNNVLGLLKTRANGEAIPLAPELEGALEKSGLKSEIPNELRTALSDNPTMLNDYQNLRESTTQPGLEVQNNLEKFRQSASENLLKAVGKEAKDFPEDISAFDAGSKLQDNLAKTIQERIEPLSQKFDEIKQKFSTVDVLDKDKASLIENLQNLAEKEGFTQAPKSPQMVAIRDAIESIPNVKNLEGLRKLQSIIGDNTYDVLNTKGLNFVGGKIKGAFRDMEDSLVERAAGVKNPAALMEIQQARTAYGQARKILDELNDRLHVGNYGGPGSFVNALKEMKPEDVLNRLSKTNDAGLIELLHRQFPEISNAVRDHQLAKTYASAIAKAPEGHALDSKTFFKSLDKMSPELKGSIFSQEQMTKINATRTLLESIPQRSNPSGTAKTLDSLMSHLPASAAAMVATISGHGLVGKAASGAVGYLMGHVARWLGRDVPDAIKLGLLKFLSHDGPIESGAFKSMIDYAAKMQAGESKINNAVKTIFKGTTYQAIKNEMPTEQDRSKLDKRLKELNENQDKLLNTGGKTGYYLPDHGAAMGQIASRASQYLNSLRPNEDKASPLDMKRVPSTVEKERFNNALDIAQDPSIILKKVSAGMITQNDLIDLKNIYPSLYQRMAQKTIEQMTDHLSKDEIIPYKTRIGLSMFLGQALDSTMKPENIALNQPQQAQAQPQMAPQKPTNGAKSLTKLPQISMTPETARAQSRASRQ
jgi:hypothetical protein